MSNSHKFASIKIAYLTCTMTRSFRVYHYFGLWITKSIQAFNFLLFEITFYYSYLFLIIRTYFSLFELKFHSSKLFLIIRTYFPLCHQGCVTYGTFKVKMLRGKCKSILFQFANVKNILTSCFESQCSWASFWLSIQLTSSL